MTVNAVSNKEQWAKHERSHCGVVQRIVHDSAVIYNWLVNTLTTNSCRIVKSDRERHVDVLFCKHDIIQLAYLLFSIWYLFLSQLRINRASTADSSSVISLWGSLFHYCFAWWYVFFFSLPLLITRCWVNMLPRNSQGDKPEYSKVNVI